MEEREDDIRVPDVKDRTGDFYETHARDYFELTRSMSVSIDGFVKRIRPGGRVLDAGCGSGRDTLTLLHNGFRVDAFDGSASLARLASEYTGIPVRSLRFQDFYARPMYDGILAAASLLHLHPDELPRVVNKLFSALVPGGVLCATFKEGDGPCTEKDGRFFNKVNVETLKQVFGKFPHIGDLDFEETIGSSSFAQPTKWLMVYATKKTLPYSL